MILILGATGFLGKYLFNRFKQENFNVAGTYFSNNQPGLLKFNLAEDTIQDLNLPMPSHIIFAAASNPTPEKSVIDADASYYANVAKTKELLEFCFQNKIIPVYISTDNVFDGKKGDYKEEDKTNPLNKYGSMKCEIEAYLFSSNKPFILLRMGKTFKLEMNDPALFTNMKSGDKLKLAANQIFTPLYIEDLFQFIKTAIEKNYQGVFHLASIPATNRYELALAAKTFFNIKNIEIIQCRLEELGLKEPRPLLISLNTEKYQKLTGKKLYPINYFLSQIK